MAGRLLGLLVAALALAIVAGVLPAASAPPGFVTRSGTQLLVDGQPYQFTGLNIYNANSDGWCWYQMRSGSALDDALTAIGANKNVFRSWFFQPLATTGGVRDWSGFDYAWDQNSLQASLTDDLGNQTQYSYDNLNRSRTETKGIVVAPALAGRDDPDTTITYGYDRDDNVVQVTDENTSVTACAFDAIDRGTSCAVTRGAGVVGTTATTYQYDGRSRMTRATDNNEPSPTSDDSIITYAYDSRSRAIEETQQIGALAARAVSSSWRAENLRAKLTYPQTGAFSRELDSTYDTLDRLNTLKDTGAAQDIVDYDYIGAGRVLQRSYPMNASRETYLDSYAGTTDVGYDGLGRAVEKQELRAAPGDREDGAGPGTCADAIDNGPDGFTDAADPDCSPLIVGFTHTYDRANNKQGETKLHNAANNEAYGYDSGDRLLNFDRAGGGAVTPLHDNWKLDGAGNWDEVLSTESGGPVTETREDSSFNEIISRNPSASLTVLSDNNGNETDDGKLLMTWDYQNRLREVRRKSDSALLGTYSYDAAGRRARKVVTNSGGLNGTTDFYLDGWQEIEERNVSDALVQQYVYGASIDEPLVLDRNLGGGDSAIGTGDDRLFYHQNTLGSVFALSTRTERGGECANAADDDGDGTVNDGCAASGPPEAGAQCVNAVDDDGDTIVNDGCPAAGGARRLGGYQYEAYGRPVSYTSGANGVVDFGGDDAVTVGGNGTANPYLFTGRRLDAESGLYYWQARYQDPVSGRFISRDPLGVWGDPVTLGNGYAYTGNRPTNFVDAGGFATTVKGSKSNSQDRWGGGGGGVPMFATTVKGSKSNSQDRWGGGPPGGALFATTVKGSKSNSQDRWGFGGGLPGGALFATTVKSGKSNADNRWGFGGGGPVFATTVKSGKSNADNRWGGGGGGGSMSIFKDCESCNEVCPGVCFMNAEDWGCFCLWILEPGRLGGGSTGCGGGGGGISAKGKDDRKDKMRIFCGPGQIFDPATGRCVGGGDPPALKKKAPDKDKRSSLGGGSGVDPVGTLAQLGG